MSTLPSASSTGAANALLSPSLIEIPADLDTPVSAYMKLCSGASGFLLESSAHSQGLGRFSFIGLAPFDRVEIRGRVMRIITATGEQSFEL